MKIYRLKTVDLSQQSKPISLYSYGHTSDRWRLQDAVWVPDVQVLYLAGSNRLEKLFLRSK